MIDAPMQSGLPSVTIDWVATSDSFARWLAVFAVVAALLACAPSTCAQQPPSTRSLSIKDLIEMSYIVNPSESPALEDRLLAPVVSPDQKSVLLLTEKGVLASNELEASVWVFDRNQVLNYIGKKTFIKPVPRLIVSLAAVSNTPVISDIRWLEDSRRIAFLGKRNSPYQQLFIADVATGALTAVSEKEDYVSAYDIKGETIAYSTLDKEVPSQEDSHDVIDVLGKSIYSLLFPAAVDPTNLDDTSILIRPSRLHLIRKGREVPISLAFQGKPLKLFMPMLSLSPDGKFLITIAPIREVPANWAEYHPALDISYYYLKPDNQRAVAEDNLWKAAEPVIIDLETTLVSPFINAPTGRSLLYIDEAPTRAVWSKEGCHVIVSNTFLPLEGDLSSEERRARSLAPAIVVVDRCRRQIQPVTFLGKSPYREKITTRVTGVSWNSSADEEVDLTYANTSKNGLAPGKVTYRLVSGVWTKSSKSGIEPERPSDERGELFVSQNLNQPPVLSALRSGDEENSIVWDPNPQLADINLGKASLHHWRDEQGNPWGGILILPPDFKVKVRYPLVIQTHGYDPERFFADGQYTTGSGGRALAAKGMIVLQMDQPDPKTLKTPENGSTALLGFKSAVDDLSAAGMVDPHRVGVIGFSFTCFHVLYALTHKPDLFAAASITDGNDLSYLQYALSTDTQNTFQEVDEQTYGGVPFGKSLANWTRDAPGFNLDQVRTPLLISALEKGLLLTEWESYSGLRRLGRPVDMLWFRKQDAPHVLVQPRHRYLSEGSAVDWFSFWLRGEEDADSAKAEQYRRWRSLRTLQDN